MEGKEGLFLFIPFILFFAVLALSKARIHPKPRRNSSYIQHLITRLADKGLSSNLRKGLLLNILCLDQQYTGSLNVSELDKIEFIVRGDPAFLHQGEIYCLDRIDELRLRLITRMQA